MNVMQEMNSRVNKTSNTLVKVIAKNVTLDKEYNRVKHEWDEVAQRVE